MALSLLCGGLGVAEASVHVVESGVTYEVLTKQDVIDGYGTKDNVETNKNDITALKNTTTDQGQQIVENRTNIATNKAAIDELKADKLRIDVASATYATKEDLRNLKDTVNGKADESTVTTALGDKANTDLSNLTADGENKIKETMSADMDLKANKADVYSKTDADTTFATKEALNAKADTAALANYATATDVDTKLAGKANKTDLENATNRIAANEGNITALQNKTVKLSADGTELKGMTTVETDALKVTGGISNGTGVTTTLTDIDNSMKQTATNTGEIANLKTKTDGQQTAINGLNEKTTQISYDAANHITSVNGMKVGQQVDMGGKDIINAGALTATGKVTGDGLAAGTGAITGGSLTVTGKVTGNGVDAGAGAITGGSLSVTGDTSLKKTDVDGALNVTGESSLKNTKVDGTLTAEKDATFEKDVTVKGTTNLKDTTVTGDLTVTGTITTDKMVFGVKPTNYTEIDQGKVTSKNSYITGAGEMISSSSTFDVEKNEVGFGNGITGDQSYHKQTSDVIMDNVNDQHNSNNRTQTKTETTDIITDENGNTSTTSQTASKNETSLKDKDGKNTNTTIDTAKGYDKTIKGENGETSTKQDELNITNTAQNGTITNDAQNIVNNASGNITTTANTMNTTVSGQATEIYGGLDTTVNGTEKHTVNGNQINTVTNGQINNITGGQTNNITGNQTTIVTNGNISNKAENITNEANTMLTDKVGDNTRVTTSTSITDTVGTANRKIENDKITDTAGDSTVTTENGKGTTFAKTGSTAFSTEAEAPTDTNIAGNHITTGRVDANELGVSDEDGANTADLSVKAGEGVKASASNGTITGSLDVTAEEVGSSVTDASGKGSTFKQRIDAIMGNVKTDAGESEVTQEGDEITSKVGLGEATNSRVTQKKGSLEAAVTDGTNTNVSYDTADESAKELKGGTKVNRLYDNLNGSQKTIADGANTNLSIDTASASVKSLTAGTKENKQQDNLDSSEKIITNGTYKTSTMQSALDITHTAKDGTITHDAKDIVNEASKSITNKVGDNTSETMKNGEITTFIKDGDKENTVTSTADGTRFTNSEAAAPVGAGTVRNTTIKGNTITTGKVTMDYADVMKDLGVHGNAKVDHNLEVGGTLDVTQRATFHDDVDIKKNLSVDGNATIKGDVSAKSYSVGGNTYIDANGINANNQKITNVADGSISEGSKDAVNGGQLYGVKRDLEHQVDKVGANAAAMANLRPMEFDPSSKWNIAAAIGNYGSETAAALGAFYRPNDNVMVNLSTAFGTGENMVGGGVSVRLGKGGNKLSREETNALKAQVNDLTARMDALLSVLNPNMSKDFPDVPENHWAYEAVSRLAGNDIVQGYPDGEFHGERTMTRYEMAEIIYNALSRGAEAERELVEEFKPELQAMAASEKATAEKAEG